MTMNSVPEEAKCALVRYRDKTIAADCPYGNAQRIVTGGEGGVANVHVIAVTIGKMHIHKKYDEVYYVLAGTGTINLAGKEHPLCPGAVAVIPAGTPHELHAAPGERLEFVIFGTPAMPISDVRARPERPDTVSA